MNRKIAISKSVLIIGAVFLFFIALLVCLSMGLGDSHLPYAFDVEVIAPLAIGGGLVVVGLSLLRFFQCNNKKSD